MNVMANSTMVWKRQADENQQSAKLLARVSTGLFIVLLATGAYAISAQARYSNLCSTIQHEAEMAQGGRELAKGLASDYCS